MLSFIDFLDYAELLFNVAQEKETVRQANPYIISCILISFISIEFFINNRLADYASLPEDKFTIHERGFLLEKQVRFIRKGANAGKFKIEHREEFRPIEDKILFLIVKFGKSKRVDRGTNIWKMFKDIKKIRDSLSHPRINKEINLTLKDAEKAIDVAKKVINFISEEVWDKKIIDW